MRLVAVRAGLLSSYPRRALGVSTAALATIAAVVTAVAVLAPELRRGFHLSLLESGATVAAVELGLAAAVLAFGEATDRLDERSVLVGGLLGGGCGALAAAFAPTAATFLLALGATGACSAAIVTAGPRLVVGVVRPSRQALALAIRQSAIPVAGALVALAIGQVAVWGGTRLALVLLAAPFFGVAAVAAACLRREPRAGAGTDAAAPAEPHPIRDVRVWRVCLAGAALLGGQTVLVAFLPLYLVDAHGFRTSGASLALSGMLALGSALLFAIGRWSDRRQARMRPLRAIGWAVAVGFGALWAASSGPAALVVAVAIVTGALALSWIPLLIAVVAELVARVRQGAAFALQQAMAATAAGLSPIAFGWCAGASSWRTAFGLTAVALLAAPALLTDPGAPRRQDEIRSGRPSAAEPS